jgi:hypothetical protein
MTRWIIVWRMNRGADHMAANPSPESIRWKLANGALPRERRGQVWVGYGSWAPCDGCDRAITPEQVEHEVIAGGRTLRLHLDCLRTWESERFAGGEDAASG